MGRAPFFDNACAVMRLTADQKEKLNKLNVALGVNKDDGVHMYMIVGEVVTEALKTHRLLTTTFLTDFDRTTKVSASRMREVLAASSSQNAEAFATAAGLAIETKMREFAKDQRRRLSFRSAVLLVVAFIFATCAAWSFGDFSSSRSSGFWRETEVNGDAVAIRNLVEWNPHLLRTLAGCGPGGSKFGWDNNRGYCSIALYIDPPPDGETTQIERFIAMATPHIRHTWPWSACLLAFVLGFLAPPAWLRLRPRLIKILRYLKGRVLQKG